MIEQLSKPSPFVIGVAGGSGSGKTTVSTYIQDVVGSEQITYLQHDDYYRDNPHLELKARERVNYDHPESLETSLLVEHLIALRSNEPVEVPMYNFATHRRMKRHAAFSPTV